MFFFLGAEKDLQPREAHPGAARGLVVGALFLFQIAAHSSTEQSQV